MFSSDLILLDQMPGCAVEGDGAADLDKGDCADQGAEAQGQDGVVAGLSLGVDLSPWLRRDGNFIHGWPLPVLKSGHSTRLDSLNGQ